MILLIGVRQTAVVKIGEDTNPGVGKNHSSKQLKLLNSQGFASAQSLREKTGRTGKNKICPQ
jgi:hypothetical protein